MSDNYVLDGQTTLDGFKKSNVEKNIKLEYITNVRNSSYEMMINGQYMMDYALNESEKLMADYVYKVGWGMYNLMIELEKIEKRKNKKPNFTNHEGQLVPPDNYPN